jgi:hypothetical protein
MAEWPRLVGTELETVWPHFNPSSTIISAVEDELHAIIGCWAFVLVPHAEGLYIAPEHRGKGAVAKLLKSSMKQIAKSYGSKTIYTSSCDPNVARLLTHLRALKLPGDHYVVPVEEL